MNSLKDVLGSLSELHENLLETSKKKQEVLISAEIKPLLTVLSEEAKLIKKINEVDKKRIDILGENAYKQSLRELIEENPNGTEKDELNRIHTRLQQIFQDLERVNKMNQELLQHSLSITNFLMEQIVPKSDGTGVYSPKAGSKDTSDSVRLFDVKA